MSKVNEVLLSKAVDCVLAYAKGEKEFQETVELQIALKNYDASKDKRFNGSFKLPNVPRPNFKVCVLANAVHEEICKKEGIDFMNVDMLKKLNKDKKLVKKLAGKYDGFVCSDTLIKLIPRLLGPGLNRAGKFPLRCGSDEDITAKITELQSTIKFQLKKVMCMNVAVGHVGMTADELLLNTTLACNFLASLTKKGWQNIQVLYIKSTMGPAQQFHF
eukprot:GSMAST32.ASY1.ANO1.696.1 assembled CDS